MDSTFFHFVCLCVCVLCRKIDSRCCCAAQCSAMQNTETVIKQKGKNKPPQLQPGTLAFTHLTGLHCLAHHQGFAMQIAVAAWEYSQPLVKNTHLRGYGFSKYHRVAWHEETFKYLDLNYRQEKQLILNCCVPLYVIKRNVAKCVIHVILNV